MATNSFKDLIVWQRSCAFTVDIYKLFSHTRDYSFKDQILRATLSISNNIAEGYARRSDKAFKNFLFIAKGSAAEVESMLLVATELKYIDIPTQQKLIEQVQEISKLLAGFIKKL